MRQRKYRCAAERIRAYRKDKIRIEAVLTQEMARRLNRVLATHGVSVSEYVRRCIDRDATERLPESQGGVKRIIPVEVARVAADALLEKAMWYRNFAELAYNRRRDYSERMEILHEAEELEDLADYFLTAIDDAERRQHILDAGIRKQRRRIKRPVLDASETPPPTQ